MLGLSRCILQVLGQEQHPRRHWEQRRCSKGLWQGVGELRAELREQLGKFYPVCGREHRILQPDARLAHGTGNLMHHPLRLAQSFVVASVMSVELTLTVLQVQYFKQRRVAEYEKEQLLKRQEAETSSRR